MKKSGMFVLLSISALLFITAQACVRVQGIFSPQEPTAQVLPITPPSISVDPTPTMRVAETSSLPAETMEFPLLFYSPLVMNYDPELWVDNTASGSNDAYQTNELVARSLHSCRIRVQGPTEFPNSASEIVRLGTVEYMRYLFDGQSGENAAMYIENRTLPGYNYESGLPIPVISGQVDEWVECRQIGEQVLSTLHAP